MESYEIEFLKKNFQNYAKICEAKDVLKELLRKYIENVISPEGEETLKNHRISTSNYEIFSRTEKRTRNFFIRYKITRLKDVAKISLGYAYNPEWDCSLYPFVDFHIKGSFYEELDDLDGAMLEKYFPEIKAFSEVDYATPYSKNIKGRCWEIGEDKFHPTSIEEIYPVLEKLLVGFVSFLRDQQKVLDES